MPISANRMSRAERRIRKAVASNLFDVWTLKQFRRATWLRTKTLVVTLEKMDREHTIHRHRQHKELSYIVSTDLRQTLLDSPSERPKPALQPRSTAEVIKR